MQISTFIIYIGQQDTMSRTLPLVTAIFVILTTTGHTDAAGCTNAVTSEGVVTLAERQLACAPLEEGESPGDLGKRFVQCVHAHLYTRTCPPGLRWDTSINNCNFPERATCGLPDLGVSPPTSQEEITGATTRQSDRTNRPIPAEDYYYKDILGDVTETTRPTPTTTTTTTTYRTTRRPASRTTRRRTTTSSPVPIITSSRTTRTTTTSVSSIVPSSGTTRTTRSVSSIVPSSRTTRRRVQTSQGRVETTKAAPQRETTKKAPLRETTKNSTEKAVESRDCLDVDTSEGSRTLLHGQRACAPLGTDEDESRLGLKFVVCSSSIVYTQECQAGLRYDEVTGLCNWPEVSTCQLQEDIPLDRSGALQPTSQTSSPPRHPTQPANTRRPSSPGLCSSDNCRLPACSCFGDSPSYVPLEDMPSFIMLTFDDAVTSTLYNNYFRALAVDNNYRLFNPNGCPIKSTFYVSHENTDYSLVKAIWDAGNEIGSHTIHHQLPQGDKDGDYPEMVAEIQGLKDEMLKATGSKSLVDSVTGFRSPYLRVAGDVQFDVLRDFGFHYDTSILNINNLQGKKPHWPYTLDYLVGECINPPCPTKSYPGLWEVPLNGWIGDDNQGCSMVDACVVGTSSWTATEGQWYQFYKRNFEDYFYPGKVPMPIFTHGSMFVNYANSYGALASWFQDLFKSHDDVWLVTPAQVIDWMKNPLNNKQMIAQKWGC